MDGGVSILVWGLLGVSKEICFGEETELERGVKEGAVQVIAVLLDGAHRWCFVKLNRSWEMKGKLCSEGYYLVDCKDQSGLISVGKLEDMARFLSDDRWV